MKMSSKATDIPKALKNINVESLLRKRGIYLQKRINNEMKKAAEPIARQILAAKNKKAEVIPEKRRHAQFTNAELNTYWEKQIHIVQTVEQHFENRVKQFITKVADGFLANLEKEHGNLKKYDTNIVKDFFSDSEDDLLTQAQIDFTPLLDSVATLAGQEALKMANVNDVYMPFKYRDTIKSNVDKFAKSMLDTDRQTLTDLVSHGLEDGESIAQIRNKITDIFPQYSANQASRIARTEVLRTSNQAAVDAWQQSGVVEGKQWLTAGAEDECAQYEGQIVTLSDSFYGSDSEFEDGDPPLHPNCRCVVVPVVVDDNSKSLKQELLTKHK